MAKRLEVYQCKICGNVVEVLNGGEGELVCCGEPMARVTENTVDAAQEKHVPVIKKGLGTVTVAVGDVAHPMEKKHFIQWIELVLDGGRVQRQFLEPGDAPEATFTASGAVIAARAYCNLHGLWKAES